MATPPVTVTSVLESIWADAGAPILITALNSVIPGISAVFALPIIGPILTWLLNGAVNKLIVAGVIDIKIGIISFMSTEAQAKWASELTILSQVQSAGGVLTDEQRAAYDSALQSLVSSHGGVANA